MNHYHIDTALTGQHWQPLRLRQFELVRTLKRAEVTESCCVAN